VPVREKKDGKWREASKIDIRPSLRCQGFQSNAVGTIRC
jgi:hypothetical protein